MKTSTIILSFIILLLSSCSPVNYYQLFETKAIDQAGDSNNLIFEDDNCKIHYNLWESGGDMGFTIYNKSDSYITLDLSKSFFVLNGVAYDYYLNRTYTTATAAGAGASASATSNNPYFWSTGLLGVSGSISASASSSIQEKPTRTIPPKTQIRIKQFSVTNFLYSDCDFIKYPANQKISSVSFEQAESPYEFYNLINYYIDDSTHIEMRNEFYVEKISNYQERTFIEYRKTNKCKETYVTPKPYFKYSYPGNFFLKYSH